MQESNVSQSEGTQSESQSESQPPPKSRRGFANLSPEERRALGRRGGRTAHERGTANRFTSEAASAAGRVPHERGTAFKWTAEQAREAGRKGGRAARRTRSGVITAGTAENGAADATKPEKAG